MRRKLAGLSHLINAYEWKYSYL